MVVTPFCSRTLMLPTLLSQNKTPQNSHGRASTFSCSSLPWALVAAAPLVLRRCLGVEEFQLDPQDLMGVCACSAQVSSGSVLRDSLKSVPHRPSLPRLSAQAQGCDSTMKLARTTIPDAAQLSAPHRDARNPETFLHTAPTWRPSITRKGSTAGKCTLRRRHRMQCGKEFVVQTRRRTRRRLRLTHPIATCLDVSAVCL